MRLLTVDQMRVVEQRAIDVGISVDLLMRNAGVNLAKLILSNKVHSAKSVVGLVGPGNNGGDTLIALAVLAKSGWDAHAYMLKGRNSQDEAYMWFEQVGGKVFFAHKDDQFVRLGNLLSHCAVLIDGLLGTGVKLPLRKDLDNILDYIKSQQSLPYIYAVDCPSGADCASGQIAESSLIADETICMGAVKKGLLSFPAFAYAGDISQVEIGIPEEYFPADHQRQRVVSAQEVKKELPDRPRDAHKGTFGKCLIIGGSVMFPGAPMLTAKAAYKIGAGLVQAATPGVVQQMMAAFCPEVTWFVLPAKEGVIDYSASEVIRKQICSGTSVALGMGMGHESTTIKFIEQLFPIQKQQTKERTIGFISENDSSYQQVEFIPPSLTIDADGLRALSKIEKWHEKLPAETILTPHLGEMCILTGLSREEIVAQRWVIAEKYAKKWGVVLVLKGALTIIADPQGNQAIIPIATPALAKAGSGDVLAGIICGLRAQGLQAFQAAWCGAWIHGKAGQLLEKRLRSSYGIMASDLVDAIAWVLSDLVSNDYDHQPVR